jgi:hypothetical protein
VAECLLCKDEALSSNPSSTKEKKKKVQIKNTGLNKVNAYFFPCI